MVYYQHPHYMVLRAANKSNIHIYTLLTIKPYFKINFANFVTSYHSKN